MPTSHAPHCRCRDCEAKGGNNGASRRVALTPLLPSALAAALITREGAPVIPRKRFALECGECGSDALACTGPFSDEASPGGDVGLRWVFACTRCGESLRVYQTSPAWRAHREAQRRPQITVSGPGVVTVGGLGPVDAETIRRAEEIARESGCTCPVVDAAGELVMEHLDGCPRKETPS